MRVYGQLPPTNFQPKQQHLPWGAAPLCLQPLHPQALPCFAAAATKPRKGALQGRPGVRAGAVLTAPPWFAKFHSTSQSAHTQEVSQSARAQRSSCPTLRPRARAGSYSVWPAGRDQGVSPRPRPCRSAHVSLDRHTLQTRFLSQMERRG